MRVIAAGCAAVAAIAWSSWVFAGDFSVRVEAGAGIPLGAPQSDALGVGGGGVAKANYSLSEFLHLQAGAGGYAFGGHAAEPSQGTPGLFAVGGGVRALGPHASASISPWADLDILYVRTGPLDRPGFAGALGASFPIDAARATCVGPFARYMHVLEGDKPGFDGTDGKFLILGVSGEIGPGTDRDKDGVMNDVDRCPDVAGPASNQGCPVFDADGDGIVDAEDGCPAKPGPDENQGCPDADTDGDGIVDRDDACPRNAGPSTNRGCPIRDADKDDFPDAEDRCPNLAGTVDGCPDPDGDGIVPPDDQCPNVAGASDDHGCPKYKQIVVTEKKIELDQKIVFAFGKTTVLSKSFGLLNEVAQAMEDNPSLRVRVEGHTDSVGDRRQNMALSEGRAQAIVEFLAAQGIARSRLGARGYGPDAPLGPNSTAEGRDRNRRVEFLLVDDAKASPASPPSTAKGN